MLSVPRRCTAMSAILLACVFTSSSGAVAADSTGIDLANACIVGVKDDSLPAKAAAMLTDEVEKRTGIRLPILSARPDAGTPCIEIHTLAGSENLDLPDGLNPPNAADGYAIWIDKSRATAAIMLLGYDDRSTLYAAGRLLRLLSMTKGKLELPADIHISTSPEVAIRGHQLGYRNTNNSYDAWNLQQYEQYIRDQIVFGTNAIELIPPEAGLDAENSKQYSRLMPVHPWEMNQKLSALLGSYGIDVWMWVPVIANVEDPEQAKDELIRMRELFQSCSHINDIFVPGGDPGHTPPHILLPWLSRLADALHETHPDARLWVSNQGFTPAQNEVLYNYLRTAEPDWLEGIVFGPWVKHSLHEARARTPRKFRIRRYPDICHNLRCQYSVPDLDPAFCQAEGREPYNPRPRAMAHIHNSMAHLADGYVTYSDGVPDDVNKVIWNAVSWDSTQPIEEILVEYGRYFISDQHGEAIAQGILALEDAWKGPLPANDDIEPNLAHWQALEKQLPEAAQSNWRLQLALLRANYDAYLQRRLARHRQIEAKAIERLQQAPQLGAKTAISQARRVLSQVETDQTASDLRARLVELGVLLNRNIGLQLDTTKYGAKNPERGAVLDFLDFALNDAPWLESQFKEILALTDRKEQLRRINTIVDWSSPGPGSFYDDLGHVGRQPHLVRQLSWEEDPGFVSSPQSEFSNRVDGGRLELKDGKLSWANQAQTLFGTPLRMRYTDLDPKARYKLAVTYTGRFRATMRLLADQTHEIHGPLPQPSKPWPVEFSIPQTATADGTLDLQWELVEQRGCQVAEVWLIKE